MDYRRLNSATLKDSYPLTRIDDSIDAPSGACWFSTFDLASGYWQVEVEENDGLAWEVCLLYLGDIITCDLSVVVCGNIAAPLHCLTETDKAFVWTPEYDVTFHRLKQVMSQALVLVYPTSECAFVLDTDASNTGIGAVLSQKQGGEERVIAYFSHSLTKSERQYCVTRKELMTLVTAVRHFDH